MAEKKKVYRLNKKNGVTYIYLDHPYWDKEKKSPRHEIECIGKLADDGVTEIYNERYKAKLEEKSNPELVSSTKFIGEKLIIEKLIENTGLKEQLLKIFDKEDVEKYLTLASYQLATEDSFVYAKEWADMRDYKANIDSQSIFELLKNTSDDLVNAFFKKWINYNTFKKSVLFDITSVASYDKNNEYLARSDNEDLENQNFLNIDLLTTYKDTIPLCYKILPESINEVSVLEQVSESLKGYKSLDYSIAGDNGFYSDDNLKYLIQNGFHFMMAVPQDTDWVNDEIAKAVPTIRFEGDVIQEDKDADIIYAITKAINHKDYGHLWVHIYYDATRKEYELRNFNMRLRMLQKEYEKENGIKSEKDIAFCKKYFELHEEEGKRIVKLNMKAVQEFQDCYSATWAIVTNMKATAKDTLKFYRLRNEIEVHFDNLKNTLDCKKISMYKKSVMKGRVFISFLALILINEFKNKLAKIDSQKLENLTWKEILSSCSNYGVRHFLKEDKDIYFVPTDLQRDIFDEFGIEVMLEK